MANRVAERLEQKIEEAERRVEHIRSLLDMVTKDPALVVLYTDVFVSPEANGVISVPTADTPKKSESDVEKVIRAFQAKGLKETCAIDEIAKSTGLKPNRVQYLVAIAPATRVRFELAGKVGKRNLWRLKDEVAVK